MNKFYIVIMFLLLSAFIDSATAMPSNDDQMILYTTLIGQCSMPNCNSMVMQCGDSNDWDHDKTVKCFNDLNDKAKDARKIANAELLGPGGLQTTCNALDRFIAGSGGKYASLKPGALYDGLGNRRQTYNANEGAFNAAYINWTPEIVEYLKKSVDSCELGTALHYGVSKADGYQLFDDIYQISQNTRKLNDDIAENQKQYQIDTHNREVANQNHISNIKSKKERIKTVRDAAIYYSAQPLSPIIASPLLTPDNKYYFGEITIDFQEKQGFLRAKIENYVDSSMRSGRPIVIPIAYAFLKTDSKTISFNPELLRLGQRIYIVGRYVENKQYSTVSGQLKLSPEIQVLFMGGS